MNAIVFDSAPARSTDCSGIFAGTELAAVTASRDISLPKRIAYQMGILGQGNLMWMDPMSETQNHVLRVDFHGTLRLEYHGARIISDAAFLANRELD